VDNSLVLIGMIKHQIEKWPIFTGEPYSNLEPMGGSNLLSSWQFHLIWQILKKYFNIFHFSISICKISTLCSLVIGTRKIKIKLFRTRYLRYILYSTFKEIAKNVGTTNMCCSYQVKRRKSQPTFRLWKRRKYLCLTRTHATTVAVPCPRCPRICGTIMATLPRNLGTTVVVSMTVS